MSIELDFRNWIKANEPIAAIVGIHVYPVVLPQRMDVENENLWQAITIPVSAEGGEYDQQGQLSTNNLTFTVKCHSFATKEETAYDNAVALAEVVKAQIVGTLTFGSEGSTYNVFATCEGRQDEQNFYYYEGKKAGVQSINLTIQLTF